MECMHYEWQVFGLRLRIGSAVLHKMSEPEDADNSCARMSEEAGGKSTEEAQELPGLGDDDSTSFPSAMVQPITEAFSQVVALNELPEN